MGLEEKPPFRKLCNYIIVTPGAVKKSKKPQTSGVTAPELFGYYDLSRADKSWKTYTRTKHNPSAKYRPGIFTAKVRGDR